MKFAKIISGAGINPKDFPKLSDKDVEVYDIRYRKKEHLNLECELFYRRPASKRNFINFLRTWENSRQEFGSIQVRLTPSVLIVYFDNHSDIFVR